MNRILDVNLNRANEALRVIEEIARFYLDNKELSKKLKYARHELNKNLNAAYADLLSSRDTKNDIGANIQNPTNKTSLINVYQANFKRLQQALRALAEFSSINNIPNNSFEELRYQSYTMEKEMFEELQKKIKTQRLQKAKLYLVTDRQKYATHDEFLDKIASALEGGVDIVQLREKTAHADEILELAKKIKELCALYDALFIINDRVDIAQIVKADGVHLGQNDIDIHSARKLLGNEVIIGISTHCPEHAKTAEENGADYIGVGPVFETPTKPGRKSVGLEYVEWASKNVSIPWFAIGGINSDNIQEVVNAGAKRTAVVRAIINADSPAMVAADIKKHYKD